MQFSNKNLIIAVALWNQQFWCIFKWKAKKIIHAIWTWIRYIRYKYSCLYFLVRVWPGKLKWNFHYSVGARVICANDYFLPPKRCPHNKAAYVGIHKMIQFETVKYGILKAKDNQSGKGECAKFMMRFFFYRNRTVLTRKIIFIFLFIDINNHMTFMSLPYQ